MSVDPEDMRAQLIAAALKEKMPQAALDPTSPWLPDLDSAVNEAIKRSGAIANNEQSGVVFKNADGHFAYSIPLTSARQDDFALRAQIPEGMSLAGIWHSHPGNDELAGFFSPADLDMADKLNVPSYIRFNKDGAIRSYTPGKTKTLRRSLYDPATTSRVTRGDVVTALPAQLYAENVPR